MVKFLQQVAYQRILCIIGALVLVALLVSLPLAFWGCKDDTKNYEAEIVNIHFATRMGGDTVVLAPPGWCARDQGRGRASRT